MSDRYLCKAKRTDNGEWLKGYYMPRPNLPEGERSYIIRPGSCVWNEVVPSTACQYTGFPDKNGKKIWENDIVIYLDENTGEYKTDIIKWNKTYAAFCRLHRSKMGLQYLIIDECIANKCEVIGNIFDNPELLEEVDNELET